jgi:hypothetical protein
MLRHSGNFIPRLVVAFLWLHTSMLPDGLIKVYIGLTKAVVTQGYLMHISSDPVPMMNL